MTPDAMMTAPKTASPMPISMTERRRLFDKPAARVEIWRKVMARDQQAGDHREARDDDQRHIAPQPGIGDEIVAFAEASTTADTH